MKVPFVNFGEQYLQHKDEYDKVIQKCITSGKLILQEDLEKFEEDLADYLNVKYVVGVANGTDALMLSLKALGIGEGDEVVTCSYTFRATIEAILHVGATPVLADIGEDWRLYKTAKTQAIIPCHIEGGTVDWIPDKDIYMVEDSCQAIGAKPLTGDTACYSFYPAKILGCLGDGGAIATDDEELAILLRRLRNHDKEEGELVAYNSRLDNIQSAFLKVRLKYLNKILERRREIAQRYDEGLDRPVVVLPPREIYQDYIVRVPNPRALKNYLEEKGVQTMLNGYPFPTGYRKGKETCLYEGQSLRLPCNETLTDKQVDYVIKKVKEFYA